MIIISDKNALFLKQFLNEKVKQKEREILDLQRFYISPSNAKFHQLKEHLEELKDIKEKVLGLL